MLAEQSVAFERGEEERAAARLLHSLHEQCQEESALAARLAHVAREEAAMVENRRVLDEQVAARRARDREEALMREAEAIRCGKWGGMGRYAISWRSTSRIRIAEVGGWF